MVGKSPRSASAQIADRVDDGLGWVNCVKKVYQVLYFNTPEPVDPSLAGSDDFDINQALGRSAFASDQERSGIDP
jgi:hypothetical protein